MTVEPGQVNDAGERNLFRLVFEQRLPRFAPLHLHFLASQDDRLVVRGQFPGQFGGDAAPVRRQHPEAGRLVDLRGTLRQDDAPVRLRRRIRFVDAEDRDLAEARIRERPPPDAGVGQCVARPVVVGEAPPAVELPEGQVEPALTAQVLQRQQLARRRQEFAAVGQRLVQVARGVQHVGGDDDVVAVAVESLLDRIDFDVQHPVVDRRFAAAEQ